MKNAQRCLALILSVLFLFSAFPVFAFAQSISGNASLVSLEGMPIVDHGSYQGNQGDSTVYNLNGQGLSTYDKGERFNGYGNVGIDGTTYTNGFEVWIARWNFRNEISWAYATFDIGGKYKTLTGKTNLIGSYNTTNFDTTVYFYDGDTLLASYNLTPSDYIKDISVNVEGVTQLKLLVKDNVAVKGGTSFAIYDLFFDGKAETSILPYGYNFYEDSYNFTNYGESISKKYFTTIYEDGPGTLLYKENKNISKGGLCFGMAYTTAAIYNGMPDCSIISTLDDGIFEYKFCDNIREIVNCNLSFPFSDICSAFTIGDNTISVEDYIKYAFIYQMSSEVAKSSSDTWGDIQNLYNTVKNFTDNNIIGVTIGMTHYEMDADGNPKTDSNGNYITSGHRVLAVGYEGRDILIDDPNNTDSLERITINDDWSWSYSGGWTSDGVNSENSITRYQTDIHRPYQILLTGNATTTNNNSDDENINTETYIEGIEEIDFDSMLVCIDTNGEIQLPANAVQVFNCDGTISSDLNNNTMYWLKDTDEIEVSNINGSISFSGDEKILSVAADNITNLSGNINDASFGVNFESEKGKQCSLEYCSIEEEKEITLVISGTTAEETVSLQNTNEGIKIDGLSKGTVTLLNDGTEIETANFDDCDNSFEISAENNEILLQTNDLGHDYSIIQYNENEHWYKCSNCDATSVKASHCNGYSTCQKKAVCDVCGVTYGDFADHEWNTSSWEKEASGHWHKCNTAGCTEKNDFAGHTPDHQGGATEEYAIKCTVCQYEIEAQLGHTHVFDKEVAEEQYLASKANCIDPAKYYKSCKCGEKGTESFASGEALGHTEGTEWKSNADNHWHECSVAGCGVIIDNSKAAHTPDRDAATESDPIKCSVCGYVITPALGHTHAHGTEWKFDKDNHWKECTCGDKANTAAHADANKDGVCDVCEYEVGTVTPDPDNKPDDTNKPSDDVQSPQTGDNSMLWLWIIMLFVSGGALVSLTVYGRKSY